MVLPDPEGEKTVQGQKATDIEYRVAVSLSKLDLPYMFQYEIMGGRTRRGGVVLDFLVFTVPLSTPLLVHGEYWHRDDATTEDKLLEAYIKSLPDYAPLVVLWGEQLKTQEDSDAAVKAAFHM